MIKVVREGAQIYTGHMFKVQFITPVGAWIHIILLLSDQLSTFTGTIETVVEPAPQSDPIHFNLGPRHDSIAGN